MASRYSFLSEERGRGFGRQTPFPAGRSTIGHKAHFSAGRSQMVTRHSPLLEERGIGSVCSTPLYWGRESLLVARHSFPLEVVQWSLDTLLCLRKERGFLSLDTRSCWKEREWFCLPDTLSCRSIESPGCWKLFLARWGDGVSYLHGTFLAGHPFLLW